MARRRLSAPVSNGAVLRAGFAAIRAEAGVPASFGAAALAEAEAAARGPALPALDLAAIPFVTLDPLGSTDLDQAMHLGRRGSGYRVWYAIADVPSFVRPGGAIDAEARTRVETVYCPDGRIPLHPPVLSEGAASLLPDQPRPAFVWVIDLDSDGLQTAVDVRRAVVRSRAQLDYAAVHAQLEAGTAGEVMGLLAEIGPLREAAEAERGGMSLGLADQEVVEDGDGWALAYRAGLSVEGWNAQISLLTGMAAAGLMLEAGVGILRTMPAADPRDVARLRRTARALGVPWPDTEPYGPVLGRADAATPRGSAFLDEAASLFRGAAYTPFDGAAPELTTHAAIAAPYTHVTAPLRRLVDRFGLELCAALCAGAEPPEWVRAALPELPALMASGVRRTNSVDRACVDLVEAAVLSGREGEEFDGTVVELRESHGRPEGAVVQLAEPAVRAVLTGQHRLGDEVRVRLELVDLAARRVRFAPAG